MATYKSQDTDLLASADAVFSRLDNLEGLGEMIKNVPEEQIPADQRQMLEQVKKVAPTLFKNAGASCVNTGRCPEGAMTCGKFNEMIKMRVE